MAEAHHFKNDQVLFSLTSPGGASLAQPADFEEAVLAPSYVRTSGLQGLKAQDLEKMLAGKRASAGPWILVSTHGISGTAAPADLETGFQLLYRISSPPATTPSNSTC